jgi:hypothetical protein
MEEKALGYGQPIKGGPGQLSSEASATRGPTDRLSVLFAPLYRKTEAEFNFRKVVVFYFII